MMRKFVIAAGLVMCAFPVAAQTCPQTGDAAPMALHEHWMMEGWERREGDADFVFSQKMSRYYDLEDSEGVFYDNFAPGDAQLFRNAAIYGANWERLQNASRSVLHALTDANDSIIGEGVASTTLGFVGTINRLDGEIIAFDGRSQLGWACKDGAWKIRHELNYARVAEPEAIAHHYRAPDGAQ